MSATVVVAIVAAISAVITGVSAPLIGAWFGRRAANRTADARKDEGSAAIQDAYTRAHEAAGRQWASYLDALQKWAEHQAAEIGRLNERIAKIEVELEGAKIRAATAEGAIGYAVAYIEMLTGWFSEYWPGKNLPPPPPELEPYLKRYRSG